MNNLSIFFYQIHDLREEHNVILVRNTDYFYKLYNKFYSTKEDICLANKIIQEL